MKYRNNLSMIKLTWLYLIIVLVSSNKLNVSSAVATSSDSNRTTSVSDVNDTNTTGNVIASDEVSSLSSSSSLNIGLIGLGGMGVAVVKCLSASASVSATATSQQQLIHVWNRSEKKRQSVIDMNLTNVIVHPTVSDTVAAADIIITMIDDWNGTVQLLIDTVSYESWRSFTVTTGHSSSSSNSNSSSNNTTNTTDTSTITETRKKTLVLLSTYSPTDLKNFINNPNFDNNVVAVMGGAIVGVPQTICTPKAFILTSSTATATATATGNDTDYHSNENQHVIDVFDNIGTHIHFAQDNGLASLANIALIQTITFGIVGHEMTQLLFQQYNKYQTKNNNTVAVDDVFLAQYNQIVTQIVPAYIGMLIPLISNHIPYVPITTFYTVMSLHLHFFHQLGIKNNTYLSSYVQYLSMTIQSTSSTNNKGIGPANWIYNAIEPEPTHSHDNSTNTFTEEL